MNSSSSTPPSDNEQDALWDLLGQSPTQQASPRFAQDAVRAARLMEQTTPWWRKRIFQPVPLAGLAAAVAAIAIMIGGHDTHSPTTRSRSTATAHTAPAATESLQEIVEYETLTAAADNLDEFTDQELACLVGF